MLISPPADTLGAPNKLSHIAVEKCNGAPAAAESVREFRCAQPERWLSESIALKTRSASLGTERANDSRVGRLSVRDAQKHPSTYGGDGIGWVGNRVLCIYGIAFN